MAVVSVMAASIAQDLRTALGEQVAVRTHVPRPFQVCEYVPDRSYGTKVGPNFWCWGHPLVDKDEVRVLGYIKRPNHPDRIQVDVILDDQGVIVAAFGDTTPGVRMRQEACDRSPVLRPARVACQLEARLARQRLAVDRRHELRGDFGAQGGKRREKPSLAVDIGSQMDDVERQWRL
ncbi:MAG TPA: hypothetical protein VJ779_22940 [Acetobacteraceae bacterium]|nr:hypothetical protein [Acetobacteraceae bacterium]